MKTTPSRKEASHERIVEVAARAIRRAGPHGVGVADIMKEAGLTHGGFYAHFASRDVLLIEALERAERDNIAALGERMAPRLAQGESRFAALIGVYLNDLQLENAERGCVIAALASELPRLSGPVRESAQQRLRGLIERVREALPDEAARAHAEQVTATMVGTVQMARTLGADEGRALLARTREALIALYAEPGR